MSDTTPDLTLAQAILRTIASHTGRAVRGVEAYAFTGGYLSVTVALAEDDVIDVTFSDPMDPGPAAGV